MIAATSIVGRTPDRAVHVVHGLSTALAALPLAFLVFIGLAGRTGPGHVRMLTCVGIVGAIVGLDLLLGLAIADRRRGGALRGAFAALYAAIAASWIATEATVRALPERTPVFEAGFPLPWLRYRLPPQGDDFAPPEQLYGLGFDVAAWWLLALAAVFAIRHRTWRRVIESHGVLATARCAALLLTGVGFLVVSSKFD